MRDYRRSPALAMVAPMIGLCFHKLISRPSLRPAHPIVAAFLFLNFSIVPAQADYERAKMHFDNLDAVTQSWIGLGLIATGDFDGLTEFGFTKRFYNAVTAFQMREGFVPDGELDTGELTQLKEKWAEFYDSLGFRYFIHPDVASKLLVPRFAFDSEERAPRGYAFERKDENLSLSFVAYPADEKTFTQLYDYMTQPTSQREVAYKRLRSEYFATSGIYRGRHYYTWISAIQGGSTGFTLTWTPAWKDLGSKLSILLANSFLPAGEATEANLPQTQPDQQDTTAPKAQEKVPESGTGTGFTVSYEGHVLTNYHVAGRCQRILLHKPGEISVAAEIVAGDETNDLALVKAQRLVNGTVASFSNGPAPKAGTEIAVYGFPLAGALSASGNIVTGNITALAGLGNDSRLFQISAPVQPGNSGGPVMDTHGKVVAVVVSKLNAIETARLTGDIPQNVNFAIKANVATNFLDGIGIRFPKGDPVETLDTPTIAERAQGFTYLIECQN